MKDVADVLSQQGTPEKDGRIIWTCVPFDLQNEFLGFVSMRNLEMRHESSLTKEALSFATELFQPMYQELFLFFFLSSETCF